MRGVHDRRCNPTFNHGGLRGRRSTDTLATALYARVDDLLKDHPELAPWRPKAGIAPKLSDAELITLAVLQVLQGFNEEARWLRYADGHLRHLFPYLPGQAGYNKRLRKSAVALQAMIRALGEDTDAWADDTWLIDSTPVETARSRPTVKGSNLAGWAGYGYCASHPPRGHCLPLLDGSAEHRCCRHPTSRRTSHQHRRRRQPDQACSYHGRILGWLCGSGQ